MFPELLAIIISRSTGTHNCPKHEQLIFYRNAGCKCYYLFFLREWRRMLTIVIFRNVSNYNLQNCLNLYFAEILNIWSSEMLAIIVSRNVGNYNFPKYWQLSFFEMLAIIFLEMLSTNVSNYIFETGDECYAIIIFRTVSNYNFQTCWRQMLANIIFRNAGDECLLL